MLGPVPKAETTLPPGSPEGTREGARGFIGSLAATNTWTVRIQARLVKNGYMKINFEETPSS